MDVKKTKMASGITKLYPRTCLGLLNCKGMSKDNIWRILPIPFPILSFPPLLFPSSPHRMCLRPSVCTSQVRTRDLGGYSTTGDLVRAVVENLRHRPVYWDVSSHPSLTLFLAWFEHMLRPTPLLCLLCLTFYQRFCYTYIYCILFCDIPKKKSSLMRSFVLLCNCIIWIVIQAVTFEFINRFFQLLCINVIKHFGHKSFLISVLLQFELKQGYCRTNPSPTQSKVS